MKDRIERARNALHMNSEAVIDALIEGLSAVGSEEQWDSESIERLLQPIQRELTALRIPLVGNTGADLDALRFWCMMGGWPLPWDPYEGDEEAAKDGWREAVADGETELSFAEWRARTLEAEA